MKPVIVFFAAFAVTAAASTGASIALHRRGLHPADSLATPDSASSDSVAGDSATRGIASDTASAGGTTTTGVPQNAILPGTPPSRSQTPATTPATATAPPGTPSPDSMASAGKRLAKLFAAMEPTVAEKNLEKFSDADAQIILAYVGPKQAAPILALMPPERVAALAKAALHGRGQ